MYVCHTSQTRALDSFRELLQAHEHDNLHSDDAADILERYNGSGIFDDTMPDSDSAYTLSKPQRATLFDYDLGQRGSDPLDVALSLGYLPAMYFASATGNYKIKQLIPCHEGTSVVFFDEDHDEKTPRSSMIHHFAFAFLYVLFGGSRWNMLIWNFLIACSQTTE